MDIILPLLAGLVTGIVAGIVSALKYIERKRRKTMEEAGELFEDFGFND